MKITHKLFAILAIAIICSLVAFAGPSTTKIFIAEYKDDALSTNAVLKFRVDAYKLAKHGYTIQHMSTRYNSKQFTHYITVVYVK